MTQDFCRDSHKKQLYVNDFHSQYLGIQADILCVWAMGMLCLLLVVLTRVRKGAVTVERPAHLRQVFSQIDDSKKSNREGSTYRYRYPSESGLQTAGICLDHSVVSEFTADMDTIASAVKQLVIAKYGGSTNTQRGRLVVDVEYTSMTNLAYHDKGQQRETLQLSQHRD